MRCSVVIIAIIMHIFANAYAEEIASTPPSTIATQAAEKIAVNNKEAIARQLKNTPIKIDSTSTNTPSATTENTSSDNATNISSSAIRRLYTPKEQEDCENKGGIIVVHYSRKSFMREVKGWSCRVQQVKPAQNTADTTAKPATTTATSPQ